MSFQHSPNHFEPVKVRETVKSHEDQPYIAKHVAGCVRMAQAQVAWRRIHQGAMQTAQTRKPINELGERSQGQKRDPHISE